MVIIYVELFLIVCLGYLSGVFVNYLTDVLPWKRRFTKPFCLNCGEPQSLASYILFWHECSKCTARRSWRTWLVELIYIGLAVWSWLNPPNAIGFWGGWLVLIYFGVVAVIDVEHRLILHPVSWAGVGVGLLIGVIRNSWWETLLGGAIGFGLMWLLYWLGEIIMRGLARMRGRTPDDVALGFGDVNLSGVLGLMLGSPLILPGLLLAIFIGGLVSFFYMLVMLILRRYHLFAALPYGPFLIIGAFVFLFLGEYLLIIFAL